ncbi:MAG: glycosyltransferase [Candidatus Saccharimonadales bacterium]
MTNSATQQERRKKIIIMTVDFGGGHKAMSRNLIDVISEYDPSIEIKVIDVIKDAWPAFSNGTSKMYADSSSNNNGFWFKVYYRLTDKFPAPLRWLGHIVFGNYAKKKYKSENPDMIIATFPLLADVAVAARDANHGTAPVLVTVTDAGNIQGIWISKVADHTLTATSDTVDYLVSRGMDPDKVSFIGFPAAKQFYNPGNKLTLRKKHGLKPDVFTILLTAGGAGLNYRKAVRVAEEIAKIRLPYQIILNAGSNDLLKQEFESIKFPYAEKVIIEGYTDKMPDYITASDVICCKSGWLTVNECLVLQRPLVLYDAVPGHEEQNVQFVVSNQFGVFEEDPGKVANHVKRLMLSPEAFKSYQDSMKQAHTNKNPYEELGALIGNYLLKG